VVPVAAAILVIIIAVVVICVLRGKSTHHKGKQCLYVVGTIAPPEQDPTSVNQYFPWLPEWLDLNIVVPIGATVVVIIVGVLVICVAISRRSRGPEQTRLRGKLFCWSSRIYLHIGERQIYYFEVKHLKLYKPHSYVHEVNVYEKFVLWSSSW
jgi:heme/copper-type cytochrome/quinol oxidase subunit 2